MLYDREQIVRDLRLTKKYRHAGEETLERIGQWALERYKTPKEALKAAKRKMHQVCGAYFDGPALDRARELVDAMPPGASGEAVRHCCRAILSCHVSTEERLPILDRLYPDLLEGLSPVETILDLGCGLHPFALPWITASDAENNGRMVQYYPYDIDQRLINAINRFFNRIGRPETARLRDLLTDCGDWTPGGVPDVVFLFKMLPCLEQQQKGCAARLLERMPGRHLIVSFPSRSLGGKDKGMADHYGAFIEKIISTLDVKARKVEYPREIFYILSRK